MGTGGGKGGLLFLLLLLQPEPVSGRKGMDQTGDIWYFLERSFPGCMSCSALLCACLLLLCCCDAVCCCVCCCDVMCVMLCVFCDVLCVYAKPSQYEVKDSKAKHTQLS